MTIMKKKVYIFICIACFFALGLLSKGIYWYNKLDGMNVPIVISTQYSPIPTEIEVYLDERLVFKADSLQTLYASSKAHLSCGVHQLKVIIDQEEIEKSFIVLPVRWIYIEIQKDNIGNYKKNPNWLTIEFSSSPFVLM